MPKTKISEFSSTPANNTDIDSINIAEGCAPSGINDAIRELMSQLKDWQSGTSNDPMVIGSSGSLTLNQGTANGVTYLNGSKVVTSGSALTFDGTNLGVGTASAGCRVDINATSNTSLSPTLRVNSNNVAVNTAISYDGIQGSGDFYIGNTSNAPVIFKQNNAEGMRLTSTGLGIGTSSPAARLSVVTASANSTAATIGGIEYGGSKRGLTIKTYQSAGGDDCGVEFNAANGLAGYGAFKFAANTTTLATLDSSGNLGLGVTPSGWNSAFKSVDVLNASFVGNVNNAQIWANSFFNAGGQSVYKANGAAATLQLNSGAFQFFTAPPGTAGNAITFTQAMTLDASGRLLVGLTSSSSGGPIQALVNGTGTSFQTNPAVFGAITTTAGREVPMIYGTDGTNSALVSMLSGNMGFFTQATERARIDSSGNLLVGTTGAMISASERVTILGSVGMSVQCTGGSANFAGAFWNNADSGDNLLLRFYTGTGGDIRGSITYNRGAGLVAYNVTSDYRAKDIIGSVINSGTLIDSVPVYMGKMKGATQERPMFIAHETPSYAHTGEKDAVDEDGNPVYQQMDASALIPVMWAEIQSLRKRLADAGL